MRFIFGVSHLLRVVIENLVGVAKISIINVYNQHYTHRFDVFKSLWRLFRPCGPYFRHEWLWFATGLPWDRNTQIGLLKPTAFNQLRPRADSSKPLKTHVLLHSTTSYTVIFQDFLFTFAVKFNTNTRASWSQIPGLLAWTAIDSEMSLIVPILRLSMLFLNVFDTFKRMKPPKPSARRGGQPSVRAITQRKRDMKGCLAVWIVWVSFYSAIIGLCVC